MKKIFVLIIVFAFIPAAFARPPYPRSEAVKKVHELRQDISTINLLNGLNLSRKQMKQVLSLARLAEEARQYAASQMKEVLPEAEEAFSALREEIVKGSPAQGYLPKRAKLINNRLKDLHQDIQADMSNRMQQIEGRLREVLTAGQIPIVSEFKPCLIPPDELGEPARAGQADPSSKLITKLRRLRELPDWAWENRKEFIVERVVERIAKHFRLTDEEMDAEYARLLKLFERARALSEIDFEVEKLTLANAIKPRDRIDELQKEIEWRLPHHRKQPKLTRFLLNDRIIPILQDRLQKNEMAKR
jgi:hypothetical protein